jgi:drug/metabolite transporter (DMT)-like permease
MPFLFIFNEIEFHFLFAVRASCPMATFATLTTLASETALALYPILIKTVPVTLQTQLLARLGTYSVAAFALATPAERAIPFRWSSVGFGLMNFVHILASYISYIYLPAGAALSLFYTYPFFNILAGVLFLGDTFPISMIPLLLLAFVGVLLIATYTGAGGEVAAKDSHDAAANAANSKPWEIVAGVVLSLLSALTESAIFLLAKSAGATPAGTMLQLYPAALLPLAAWIFLQPTAANSPSISATLPQTALLVGFNLIVGFLGYYLRMFSIPLLPTAVFSILTFVGVVAGYVWGLLFAKEVPTLGALAGSGLIALAVGFLKGGSK